MSQQCKLSGSERVKGDLERRASIAGPVDRNGIQNRLTEVSRSICGPVCDKSKFKSGENTTVGAAI